MPSHPSPATLVTGVTGTIGVDLLVALMASSEASIRVIIRSAEQHPARARFEALRGELQGRGVAETELGRLSMVEGDLTQQQFGLDRDQYLELAAATRSILHAAATTRFSLPIEAARVANLHTTRNVIAFARDCAGLDRLGYASTAYVAGTRKGTILEGQLEPTEFVNTYEQTKFEAEAELRAAAGDLPIAVYRPSIIIGSSTTGRVTTMNAVHRAVELAYRGLIPMVPGEADTRLELVDVEFVARSMGYLFNEAFVAGTTYHLVAGPQRSFTLTEFIESTYRLIGDIDPSWLTRGIEAPPIVDGAVFDMLRTMISTVEDPEGAAVLAALNNFVPQLLYPKDFDTTNRDAALPADIAPGDIRDYYPEIMRYCLETDWGRSPMATHR